MSLPATPLDIFFNLLMESPPPAPEVAGAFIALADPLICGYLGLAFMPENPNMAQARAMTALVLYNRRGAEGELKRMEGDITSWFDGLPDIVRLQLRPFRQARAVSWLPPLSLPEGFSP